MFLLTNHVSVRVSHALFIRSTGEYKSLCEEKFNHYLFIRKQKNNVSATSEMFYPRQQPLDYSLYQQAWCLFW